MTEEYVVGHYFKRAVVADVLLGSSALHEAACAQTLQSRLAASSAAEQSSTRIRSAR
jgi:hypothetical protein